MSGSPALALACWSEARHENTPPTDLGRELVRFFEDYLPAQRGMSPHTIRSYRDALLLLLQFTSRDIKRGVERIAISDLAADRVVRFLRFLETERKNSIATRNARLGAIHVFARFLASHHPEQLGSLQRVIGLPFKHGAREAPSSTWSARRWTPY